MNILSLSNQFEVTDLLHYLEVTDATLGKINIINKIKLPAELSFTPK